MDTHILKSDVSKEKQRFEDNKVVVLIGSTGEGKSTLGTFLIRGSEYRTNKPFEAGHWVTAETQTVSSASLTTDNYKFTFIDTPGLNESLVADIGNMLKVVDAVKESKISCIIICKKFLGRISQQHNAIISFYNRLFRKCFASNLLIAITNVPQDPYNCQFRASRGIDVQHYCDEVAFEVMKLANLKNKPVCLTIDAAPLKSTEQISLTEREQILEAISGMQEVDMADIQFAKTPGMIEMDAYEIKKLQATIQAFISQLNTNKSEFKAIQNSVNEQISKKVNIDAKIKKNKLELEALTQNPEGEILIATKEFRGSLLQSVLQRSTEFEISLVCPASRYLVTKANNVSWHEITLHPNKITGKLTGNSFVATQATIIVFGKRKDFFKADIKALEDTLEMNTHFSQQHDRELRHIIEKQAATDKSIKEYSEKILEWQSKIEGLKEEYVDKNMVDDYIKHIQKRFE